MAAIAKAGAHDIEAAPTAGPHQPGPTLLPAPIAQTISLATRSASLAVRLGSLVGCYSLDAARFTTVSSLELARGMVEGVLNMAARDTICQSRSGLAAADAETILERSLESLHFAVTQIVFWTSASFRLTGTTISTASEATQLILGSLDQLLGSTDSSRAMASIITLIRREFNNPATGASGEKVGVADLVLALSAFAYLQRACRRSAAEDARIQAYEEVIWDVVVLSDGERIDVDRDDFDKARQLNPPASGQLYDGDGLDIRCDSGDDDNAIMERFRQHITSNLAPGTSVSLSNSITSVQTITVDVNGPQLLSLPTPPGAEIVETRGPASAPGNRLSWAHDRDGDASYRVVYRIQRDKFRSTSFRGEEEETGPTVVELPDDSSAAVKAIPKLSSPPTIASKSAASNLVGSETVTSPSASTTGSAPTLATPRVGEARSKSFSNPTSLQATSYETAANLKKQRSPPAPPARRSSDNKNQPGVDAAKRSLSKKKGENALGASKQGDKKTGLKQVLKESSQSLSNMWNKDGSDTEASRPSTSKPKPQWKGAGTTNSTNSTGKLKPSAARGQTQQVQRTSPGYRPQTPDPFPRSSSRASYVSIHDRRRDSIVSLTDAYSRNSAGALRPASPTIYRTDYSAQETVSRPHGDGYPSGHMPPPSPHKGRQHRRSTSYAPSLYSLATNDSQTSLLLSSYYQKSAYTSSDALNTLRSEGFVDGTFPEGHLLPNIARYMRYSSACYGSQFMKLLGISKDLPVPQVADGTHRDVRHFVHHTETLDGNILLASFVDPQGGSDATGSTGTGVPLVHYISLDHEAKAVVLACRGTLGFEDVLADLTCDYDRLVWRGRSYRVHKGVHASARRLLYGDDGRVLVTLKEALLEFPDYGLVLCGHSLGGGVTSLLGVMLAEPNADGPGFVISAEPQGKLLTQGFFSVDSKFSDVRLPRGRRIHVYAYGPPGVMSTSLRKITRGLITTVVHGNDIVPHLSLGVLHDFQGLALAFKNDDNHTKAEIKRRMWKTFQVGLADRWYQTTPMAPKEGDDEWVLPAIQTLRETMKGKKLVPPGEVFAIETKRVLRRDAFMQLDEGSIGRPARRVVLKYIRDVEGRFAEMRFGAGLLTDHSPAKYEDALNKLRLGVVE